MAWTILIVLEKSCSLILLGFCGRCSQGKVLFFRNIILQLVGYLGLELVNLNKSILSVYFVSVLLAAASLKRDYLCPSSNACSIFKRNHSSVSGDFSMNIKLKT